MRERGMKERQWRNASAHRHAEAESHYRRS